MRTLNWLLVTFWLALLVSHGGSHSGEHAPRHQPQQQQHWLRSVPAHHARHHHPHPHQHQQQYSQHNQQQADESVATTQTAPTHHNHQHRQRQQQQQHVDWQQSPKNSAENAISATTKQPAHKMNAPHKSHRQQHHQHSGSGHAHNHSKAALALESSTVASVSSLGVRQSKSMSDATLLHHFKATHATQRSHAAALRSKHAASELDYAADYYGEDDDDGDDAEEAEEEYNVDAGDDWADERQLSNSANSLSDRAYARVTRDHHRHHYHGHGQRFAFDALHQDYADDEPYSPTEQAGGVPGDLTKQKIDELGTEEAVQQSHDKYVKEQRQYRQKSDVQLAAEHLNRMDAVARCKRPLPRVVPVSDETSKVFRPSCTWLHRCGADTGCCRSTWEVCTNKSYENVQVYVYVYSISTGRSEIEVKTLENHTECHCVNRSYIPRYKRSGVGESPMRLPAPYHRDYEMDGEDVEDEYWNEPLCNCPTHFDALSAEEELEPEPEPGHHGAWRRSTHNANKIGCRCDCRSNNMPCQRLKRGDEGFAVEDRKCIAERRCKAPTCGSGEYSLQTGRCPRAWTHKRTSTHHNYGIG